MTADREVIVRRLSAMRELLDHLATLEIRSVADLQPLGVRLQVERALTQLVNLAAELNAHVGVTALARPPEDYRDGFDLAARAGFITQETAALLKPSVGLRNVLTHEYVDVDLRMVAAAVPFALRDYRRYVREFARATAQAASGRVPPEA